MWSWSRLASVAEDLILGHPEVAAVARRTGRAELDEHAQGVEARGQGGVPVLVLVPGDELRTGGQDALEDVALEGRSHDDHVAGAGDDSG